MTGKLHSCFKMS